MIQGAVHIEQIDIESLGIIANAIVNTVCAVQYNFADESCAVVVTDMLQKCCKIHHGRRLAGVNAELAEIRIITLV